MIYTVPRVIGSYAIEDVQARRLWNWLLRRQGLSDETRLRSVAEIAYASLGLHAARLPSPYATVLARSKSPTVALSLFSPTARHELTTIRCMRKTLHALPLELAAVAHSATKHFRERDALRAIANAGVSGREVTRSTDVIVKFLKSNGAVHCRDIEADVTGRGLSVVAVRVALKLAWERGTLTYQNDAAGWNRGHRKFGLTHLIYPALDMAMDGVKATNRLLEAYFDRYGPASLRDAKWWSGLSRAAIVTAMNESSREIVAVRTPWTESALYMFQDRLDEYTSAASDEMATGINFLAPEDVALKAYFESRRRYLGALSPGRAFNQIGEVLPTIVLEGQVVGTWRWHSSRKVVTASLARGCGSSQLRQDVERAVTAMTSSLRAGWIKAMGR